jgi:phage terminase large subunit-like protein
MAANVAVQQDAAGNIKPDKDKASEKIDGIVALIMALGIDMSNKPEEKPNSYLESMEMVIL